MKKFLALSLLAACAALPLAAAAAEASVYADVLSAYVYRGQVGNDEAVFQPGLDVTGPLGLGASFWGSMNLTDNPSVWYPDTAGEFGEYNLGLNWTCPGEGLVSLTLGGLAFVYPQDSSAVETDVEDNVVLGEDGLPVVSEAPADGGFEVFAEAAAEEVILQPTLRFCHDLDNSDDWIALLSIGHSLPFSDNLSLDLGATVGYAGEYYVSDNYNESDAGSAFTHVQLDAGLNYALTESASVGLKGSFSSIIDSDIRDDIEAYEGGYPDVDIFYGGVTASYSF